LLVLDSHQGIGAANILQIDPHAGAQQVWLSGGLLQQSTDMAFDGQGNLIVSNFANGSTSSVVRINVTTGEQTQVATGGYLVGTTSIAIDSDGSYVAVNDYPILSPPSPTVSRVNANTGTQTLIAEAPGHSGSPMTVPGKCLLDADRDILVTNLKWDNDGVAGILRVDASSGSISILSSGNHFGPSEAPRDLAFRFSDPHDNLLVCSQNFVTPSLSSVMEVDPATGEQTVISSGGLILSPISIALGGPGLAYVGNYRGGGSGQLPVNIVAVNLTSGAQSLVWSGESLVTPQAILVIPEPSVSAATIVLFAAARRRRR
jgi:hypothetical protein